MYVSNGMLYSASNDNTLLEALVEYNLHDVD